MGKGVELVRGGVRKEVGWVGNEEEDGEFEKGKKEMRKGDYGEIEKY